MLIEINLVTFLYFLFYTYWKHEISIVVTTDEI